MKSVSFLLFVCICMFTSTAQADYTIFAVTDASAVNPANPDIDGDWIIWQDDRNGSATTDIYGYTLAEPNEVPICIYSGEQEVPAVSGRYAVWQDYRNTRRDIRVFDLQDRTEPIFVNLTMNNSFHKRYPDISDDVIVWQDYRNGDTDIYMYNIATDTEQAVYNDGAENWGQYNPAVDGNTVVWQDNRSPYQIYMSNISGGTPSAPQVVKASADNQWRPAISGNLVVWEELDTLNNVTLVAYDLGVGSMIWSYAVAGTQANAAVSDGIIVWQEDNGSDYDILGYDTATGAYLDIATTNANDTVPAISGRRVVWQRNTTAIVGAEIPSPTVLQVDTPSADRMFLAKTRIGISWQIGAGTPPEYLDIEYTLNNGSSWKVIAQDIPFTDFQYDWTSIPDANAIDSCRVRIRDASDSTTSGVSGVFSIFQCDTALTADLTGDCLVNLADVAVLASQWLVCGNPHDPSWCPGN